MAIEVFTLNGYVVDSYGNPEQWVFLSEKITYVIQRERAANENFLSEIRAYVLQTGTPVSGVAVPRTIGYIVDRNEKSLYDSAPNNAALYRDPGVVIARSARYNIEPDSRSMGVGISTLRHHSPGVIAHRSTMYTIEIP